MTEPDETGIDSLSLQDSIRSETSTLASEGSIFSLHRASFDTTPSSVESAAASLRNLSDASLSSSYIPADNHDVQHGRIQKTNEETLSADALTIRQACRYDCFCWCHTMNSSINGLPKASELKNHCTEPSCQGAEPSTHDALIPSFVRKAISAVIWSRSIKIRYNLNTYRMVAEGSDALRYVKHGNLERLQMCIQTGKATQWDTAPDGWSLLHVSLRVQNLLEKLSLW